MKRLLILVAMIVAGCGGSADLFKGDEIVAELSNGQPSCSQGVSGPTLHTSEAETTSNAGITYTSTIVTCQWTCAHSDKFGFTRAFVEAVFYTDQDNAWRMDLLRVDPYQNRVVCHD